MNRLIFGVLGAALAALAGCGGVGGVPGQAGGLLRTTRPAWTTYHHDGVRSGFDPNSTSPVTPSRAWQSPALDGAVYAEPLLYGSTVFVETENDTVYALDAASGHIVWRHHLATAVPAGELRCGDIDPVGITSTPVIDPTSRTIYVVGDEWDGHRAASIHHAMYGLSLSTGRLAAEPVTVDPPGSRPADQLQRPGLALDAGKVVIGFGGNGDCGDYHGWLVAVPEAGGSLRSFEIDPRASQGAIWGSGNAPAIDSRGDIWAATSNGSPASFGYQNSVLRLDSNLHLKDYWAPANWSALDANDLDVGASMPVLLPDGLVFQIGKGGDGYLLSAAKLGGEGGTPVYQATVCGASKGGGIYHRGVLYVVCNSGRTAAGNGLHALSLDTTGRRFSALPGWRIPPGALGPPILAGGLVWSAGWRNGILYGLDPATGAVRFSANLGGFEHFATPSAGGGRLFVANRDRVTAFRIAH